MPDVNLPLSGPVAQAFRPWAPLFSAFGSQIGLINVSVGKSSNPAVEEDVLTDVASYGRQLGRIEDALVVLLKHFAPSEELSDFEKRAIDDLKRMLHDTADVKKRHSAKLVLGS
jgi:hypothetical protein